MRIKGGFARFWIIQLHFLDDLDTFQIIWKLSRLSRHTFRSSRLFLDYPNTFSRLSGHFLDRLETFQIIQTFPHELDTFSRLSGQSGYFPDHPDTFIWVFCVAFGHFPNYPEILQPIINLLQKLSELAKTFRISSGYFVQHPDIFQVIQKFFSQ